MRIVRGLGDQLSAHGVLTQKDLHTRTTERVDE